MNKGTVDKGTVNKGTVNKGTVNKRTVNKSTVSKRVWMLSHAVASGLLLSSSVFGQQLEVDGSQQLETETTQQLEPKNVQKVGPSEFSITWGGQGTLICGGFASNPTFRVPEDLGFGQWLECYVDYAEGRSNLIRILCNENSCAAHVGRTKNEFVIEPNLVSDGTEPTLIIERIIYTQPIPKTLATSESGSGDEGAVTHSAPAGEPTKENQTHIPDGYAVQLLAGKDRTEIERLISQHGLGDADILRVRVNDELLYVLILGYYDSWAEANRAVLALPAGLPEPWTRPTAGLRAVIAAEEGE